MRKEMAGGLACAGMTSFMAVNLLVTSAAITRWRARMAGEEASNPAVLYHGRYRRRNSRIGTGDDDQSGRIYVRRSGNRCRNRGGNGAHDKHLASGGIHQRRKLRNELGHHEHSGQTEAVVFDGRFPCCWFAAAYDGSVNDAAGFHHHKCGPVLGRRRFVQHWARRSQQSCIEESKSGMR